MQKIDLPARWTARLVTAPDDAPAELLNREIPALVPGCIHLDLLREGLIPDPYLDCNETQVQWIGLADWEFETTFEVTAETLAEERVDLVCEGLDAVANLLINDVHIGMSESMHVEHRFSIKEHLTIGENTIKIVFFSAAHYARTMRDDLGNLPHANSYPNCEPFHFIRKNACNFGWDWGPALITCGVWKPIRLEAWSVARIKSVRPLVKVANEKVAVVDVVVELDYVDMNNAPCELGVWVESADDRRDKNHAILEVSEARDQGITHSTLYIKNPNLWWPTGYGEQPLYDLKVALWTDNINDAETINTEHWQANIGLREVELDTTPDEIGAPWTIQINGQPVWCKGANWIPDDVFLPRANDPKRLRERLQQAKDAGMNMIRVWGGGIYETDEFYAICDELGLLVWQDFLFACAAYSEEEPLRDLVEAEARYNITRLSKHPSLVLWNGCNENIWGYFDWNWQLKVEDRTWGAGYYFELLPALVKELNPTVPYWPGSPYSGSMDIHPLADQYGNKHMWDTWNEVNFTYFRRYSPRFASEFGHQAPPTYATLARAIPDDELNPYSPAMLQHQKAGDGNAKLHHRLNEHFQTPESFDDWIYLTQLVQARAMTTACEWFRTRHQCSGALSWQLNDCWPAVSWSAIDGDGRPKPLYFAARQFFRERLLTIQPDGAGLALWAHNDSDEYWGEKVEIELVRLSDDVVVDFFDWRVAASPRALEKFALTRLKHFRIDKRDHFFRAKTKTQTAFWFFDIDKHLSYPEPKWTWEIEGQIVRFTAQTLLRDLIVNADRFGGVADAGLVTLLPGETWEVQISGADLSQIDFGGRPVVQCANWYGAK